MKSRIILVNKCGRGFLTLEAMIAFLVMSMMIPAALSLSWSSDSLMISAQKELLAMSASSTIISKGASDQSLKRASAYSHEFGGSSCNLIPATAVKGFTGMSIVQPQTVYFGSAAAIGDISLVARDGFIYESMASTNHALPDLYIIDARVPASSILVSSLNTGPGLGQLALAGHYIYAANESSVTQLDVIDIADRAHPILAGKLKLPLPTATTTAPVAHSIFYQDGRIYLGTEKWNGDEFNVIDVSNPLMPVYLGGFKTSTLISSIYVRNGFAYVAGSDTQQLRVLDVHDPHNINELSHFSPTGSDILEGKSLNERDVSATSTMLFFGRVGGGFNNVNQYELFSFNLYVDPTAQQPLTSHDIPGGVYGIVTGRNSLFLATHATSSPLQIWTDDLSKEIYSSGVVAGLSAPSMLACDQSILYVAVPTSYGFAAVTPY